MRAADVALVLNERIPATGVPDSFWDGAPDLAVEVLSPNDSPSDVLDKVRDYLAAGAEQVWVADPKKQHDFRVQIVAGCADADGTRDVGRGGRSSRF